MECRSGWHCRGGGRRYGRVCVCRRVDNRVGVCVCIGGCCASTSTVGDGWVIGVGHGVRYGCVGPIVGERLHIGRPILGRQPG